MARRVASLFADLNLNDHMTPALNTARDNLDSFSGRLKTAGDKVGAFGRRVSVATLPVIGAFGLAVKASVDFEEAFAGVEKTVGGTEEELDILRKTIRDMATDTSNPLSALDDAHVTIAGIMEVAGQLGVPREQLGDFTQTMGELGISTNVTAVEASNLVARFANITGMDFNNVDEFASTVVDLGNNSATTEKEILEMAMRIGAAGTAAGLEEKDILAFATALSSVGVSSELGGGNFSRFVNAMVEGAAKGGPALDTMAKAAGMSADGFREMMQNDPSGAIQDLLEGLGEMNQSDRLQALRDLGLTGSEAADVIGRIANASDLVDDSLTRANAAWEENTALNIEAAAKAETTRGNFNKAKNALNDLAIEIGDALTPALNDLLEKFTPVVNKVADFVAENPKAVQAAAALTIGLFALGAGAAILGPIIGGLGSVIAFGGTALTVALGAAKIAMVAMTGPIGLVVLAIGGIIAAAAALGVDLGPLMDAAKKVFQGFADVVTGIIGGVIDVIGGVVTAVSDAVGAIGNLIDSAAGILDGPTREEFITANHEIVNAGGGEHYVAGVPRLGGVGSQGSGGQAYIQGHSAGTPWTGSGSRSAVAGVVHHQEAVIPTGGMQVIPSPGGLMLEGGMGGGSGPRVVINGPITVQASNIGELYEQLEREAATRTRRRN